MMDELNHRLSRPEISTAIRSARPVLSAAAEREMEKFNSSAAFMTLSRVAFDTRSGRVKERETVEMETCASCATS